MASNLQDGLQCYYRLNENIDVAINPTVKDASDNLLDATYFEDSEEDPTNPGFEAWVHPVTNKESLGLVLEGHENEGVKLPNAEQLGIEKNDYTVSLWAKLPESAPKSQVLFSVAESDGAPNRLWIATKDQTAGQGGLAGQVRVMSTRFPSAPGKRPYDDYVITSEPNYAGELVHITLTAKVESTGDGEKDWKHTYTMYINGDEEIISTEREGSKACAPIGLSPTDPNGLGPDIITLGGDVDNHNFPIVSDWFSGLLADVAVWSKVLTPEQALEVYQDNIFDIAVAGGMVRLRLLG